MNSKKHRDAIVRALNDVKIVIAPTNAITFSDEDLPTEGRVHNHPLFIQAIVKSKKTSCVMVDDGSTINVCPLRLLYKFGMNIENLEQSNMIIRAYDNSKKPVVRTFKAVVTMGDIESVTKFIVLYIPPTFALLLGRPRYHLMGGIPSIVH